MSYWEKGVIREEVSIKSGLEDILIGLFVLLIFAPINDFLEEYPFFIPGFLIFYGLLFYVLFFSNRFISDYLRSNTIQIHNMRKRILLSWLVVISFLFIYIYLFFFVNIGKVLIFPVSTLIINIYSFIQTKKFRFLGYSALFLVGFVAYWVMPTLHPVLKWGFLFGLPCLVMIVTGFMIFIRFRKSLSDNTQPPAEV